MKKILLLGSTGSIGRQTLEVIDEFPDRLALVGIVAGRPSRTYSAQLEKYRVCGRLASEAILDYPALLSECRPDLVLNAISGGAGLRATWDCLAQGCDVAVANKESLVMAGTALKALAHRSGSRILPVDSEHSALLQCLRGCPPEEVDRLILTASGGPFRGWSRADLAEVTVEEALNHPTWNMGPKITVDSATLVNKALEMIEAQVLFEIETSRIEVVVHPESVIHSLVKLTDGSLIGHLGPTDMKLPIQYALSWPERWTRPPTGWSLEDLQSLHFERPDNIAFPSLDLARQVMDQPSSAPITFNAANEIAVEYFLNHRLRFTEIFEVIARALERQPARQVESLDEILEVDQQTRESTRQWILSS